MAYTGEKKLALMSVEGGPTLVKAEVEAFSRTPHLSIEMLGIEVDGCQIAFAIESQQVLAIKLMTEDNGLGEDLNSISVLGVGAYGRGEDEDMNFVKAKISVTGGRMMVVPTEDVSGHQSLAAVDPRIVAVKMAGQRGENTVKQVVDTGRDLMLMRLTQSSPPNQVIDVVQIVLIGVNRSHRFVRLKLNGTVYVAMLDDMGRNGLSFSRLAKLTKEDVLENIGDIRGELLQALVGSNGVTTPGEIAHDVSLPRIR